MTIFQPDRHLLLQFVKEHAGRLNGFVLDVGGGNGRYKGLFRHVKRYVILDPDPAVKPDILSGAESIPLADDSVDGVICTQVLGAVWDPQKALDEMVRVLKPGGLLLLTESLTAALYDRSRDYWRFSGEALRRLCGDRCEVLRLESRGGYYSLQAQQKIRYLIDRYDLYKRPLVGRFVNCYALAAGHLALRRDRKRRRQGRGGDDNDNAFTIGYNLLARKRHEPAPAHR